MLNSRDINDLHPHVKEQYLKVKAELKSVGINIIETSTLRDDEYQGTLYAQGRTKPGNIVTQIAVTGAHGIGCAVDVVPVDNGVAIWNNEKYWAKIGQIAKKHGFEWGGTWKGFIDRPHLELTEGLSFKEIRSGKRPSFFNAKPVMKPLDDFEKGLLWLNGDIDFDIEYWRAKAQPDKVVQGEYIRTVIERLGKKHG